jgi:hypothetical protein
MIFFTSGLCRGVNKVRCSLREHHHRGSICLKLHVRTEISEITQKYIILSQFQCSGFEIRKSRPSLPHSFQGHCEAFGPRPDGKPHDVPDLAFGNFPSLALSCLVISTRSLPCKRKLKPPSQTLACCLQVSPTRLG